MIKQILTITGLLLTVFFASYFLTALAVEMIIGDEVYGEDITITAEVVGLEVKPNFGVQNQHQYNEQPALNIHKLEVAQ